MSIKKVCTCSFNRGQVPHDDGCPRYSSVSESQPISASTIELSRELAKRQFKLWLDNKTFDVRRNPYPPMTHESAQWLRCEADWIDTVLGGGDANHSS
jgi:hypothetical protein